MCTRSCLVVLYTACNARLRPMQSPTRTRAEISKSSGVRIGLMCHWRRESYRAKCYIPGENCKEGDTLYYQPTKMSGDSTFTPWQTASRQMPWQTALTAKSRGRYEKSPLFQKRLTIMYKLMCFPFVCFFSAFCYISESDLQKILEMNCRISMILN